MKLSAFEIMVLRWASLGKTPEEIAEIEGKSREAVNDHLDRLVAGLQATSLSAAVEEAKARKLI